MSENCYCIYDNPATMCREYWENKKLICSLSVHKIFTKEIISEPAWVKKFKKTPWIPGAIEGDENAIQREPTPPDEPVEKSEEIINPLKPITLEEARESWLKSHLSYHNLLIENLNNLISEKPFMGQGLLTLKIDRVVETFDALLIACLNLKNAGWGIYGIVSLKDKSPLIFTNFDELRRILENAVEREYHTDFITFNFKWRQF